VAVDVTTGLPAPGTALDPWLIELSPTRLRSAKYAYTSDTREVVMAPTRRWVVG
jgi:hypothetical protein